MVTQSKDSALTCLPCFSWSTIALGNIPVEVYVYVCVWVWVCVCVCVYVCVCVGGWVWVWVCGGREWFGHVALQVPHVKQEECYFTYVPQFICVY